MMRRSDGATKGPSGWWTDRLVTQVNRAAGSNHRRADSSLSPSVFSVLSAVYLFFSSDWGNGTVRTKGVPHSPQRPTPCSVGVPRRSCPHLRQRMERS